MKKVLLFMIASVALASCDDDDNGCSVTDYETTTINHGSYTIQANKATIYDCGDEYRLQVDNGGTVTVFPKKETEIIYDKDNKILTIAEK